MIELEAGLSRYVEEHTIASDPALEALASSPTDRVVADPRVICAMLTVRDAITLIRRAS